MDVAARRRTAAHSSKHCGESGAAELFQFSGELGRHECTVPRWGPHAAAHVGVAVGVGIEWGEVLSTGVK